MKPLNCCVFTQVPCYPAPPCPHIPFMLKNGIVSDFKGNISKFLLCLASLNKKKERKGKVNPNIFLNFSCGFLPPPSSECACPSAGFAFFSLVTVVNTANQQSSSVSRFPSSVRSGTAGIFKQSLYLRLFVGFSKQEIPRSVF